MAVKCTKKKEGRKRGRPSTGFDKRAYMKEYMRKRRAKIVDQKLQLPYNPTQPETPTCPQSYW